MHPGPHADNSDLSPALRLIGVRALVLTGGTGAAIALVRDGSMICRVSVGASAPPLGCQLDTTSGFSGESVRTGKALRCEDSETDPHVDVASCRQLGIRSILAAPILCEGDVVGLLEVFSTRPFAFDDGHLALVERLAQTTLLAPPAKSTLPPKLLVELEPAYRVFFRNLVDILHVPRTTPLKLTSPPARFWADVFVPSRLPWERVLQSMLLHVIMVVALGSFLEVSLFQTPSVQPLAFNKSDVIYYSPSEYLREIGTGRAPSRLPKGRHLVLAEQSIVTAPHEQNSRAQTIIPPPNVKLKQELRLLHLTAWNSVIPAAPLTATTLTRRNTPAALIAVVAPPPEISQTSGRRTSTGWDPTSVVAPSTAVIGPPPAMHQLVHQNGGINIGYVEVVAPAPQMSGHGQGQFSAMVQATLREGLSSVVPPPPSVNGSGNPRRQGIGSLSAAALQGALPPTVIGSVSDTSRGPIAPDSHPPNVRSTAEVIGDGQGTLADTRELSVNFIGLALALPSSSYFSSHEVFIAEDRLSRYQSRLIKLVYEFLPYQTRLSDYGPNYPDVDKLRVTRDPTCDETLMQVISSANVTGRTQPDLLQQALKYSGRESELECYRTTADDYRRARARHH